MKRVMRVSMRHNPDFKHTEINLTAAEESHKAVSGSVLSS